MIKFYTEQLNDKLYSELLPILKASRDEVYAIKEDKTLANSMNLDNVLTSNVNYNYYLEKQRQGLLHISTARNEKDELVGHWSLVLNFHGQSKNLLIANCENLHIIKEYRKGDNAKRFMIYTEDVLRKKGVKQINFGVNPQLGTDNMLKRAGWSLDEIVFTKGL